MNEKVFKFARLFLGLIYVVFGLNGFLQFLPMPPMPEAAGAFAGALGATGYMFPFIKVTEIACGLALLSGFFSPLALIVLAPITLNIFMFHLVLTPGLQNVVLPVVMIVAQFLAAKGYWKKFEPLLKP